MRKYNIVIVFVLLIFLVGVIINKYIYEKNNYYFTIYNIEKEKINTDEELEKQKQKINEIHSYDSFSYNFKYYNISWKIYISSDNYLHISNDENIQGQVISNIKFKSIYPNSYTNSTSIRFYAISIDNKPYTINLSNNDINSIQIEKLTGYYTNFVDVEIKSDKYTVDNSIYGLGKNNFIFNVTNGMIYLPTTICLYNEIYVYEDNTMINKNGKIIADDEGNPYKLKYIFNVVLYDEFIQNTSYIVITEDNKFLYFNDDLSKVYELNRKINKVEFDKNEPYKKGLLTLTLNMNSKIYFDVECNEYYCVNKF